MLRVRKMLSIFLTALFTILTMLQSIPAQAASKAITVPQVTFANAPVTEYTVGDRVGFNIFSPNYGGKVEYRVVLWNDSQKTYYDLWNPGNGYPTCYYSKWQPYGNNIFTLGWIINEPGSYRITVYAKRVGVPSSKAAMKGYNCDSYMESVAFRVKAKNEIVSFMPISDITVNQGSVPVLPRTVTVIMTDGTQKVLNVAWGSIDTTRLGTFVIDGTVEGTYKKASVRLIINQGTFSVDNVYSVQAKNSNEVDVSLINKIEFIPTTARFSIRDSYNTSVRVYTLVMSSDKKTIQISTDYMLPGRTYVLTIDGRDYSFVVPNSSAGTVTITADDVEVGVGKTAEPDLTVSSRDVTLSFSSQDTDIAAVNSESGMVYGVKPGKTTINVYAKKSGVVVGYTTYDVLVFNAQIPYRYNCEAESEDNCDGTATITVSVRDSDDDPINGLDASDFVIEMNDDYDGYDDEYAIGSRRSPFDDFEVVDDEEGEYEFIFTPDEADYGKVFEINIMVNDKYVCKGLEISATDEEDDVDPVPVDVAMNFNVNNFDGTVDFEEPPEFTIKQNTRLVDIELRVTDKHMDTDDVTAYIKYGSNTKSTLGMFEYAGEDEDEADTSIFSLSKSYTFSKVGTYTITATFVDKMGNKGLATIKIIVEA